MESTKFGQFQCRTKGRGNEGRKRNLRDRRKNEGYRLRKGWRDQGWECRKMSFAPCTKMFTPSSLCCRVLYSPPLKDCHRSTNDRCEGGGWGLLVETRLTAVTLCFGVKKYHPIQRFSCFTHCLITLYHVMGPW